MISIFKESSGQFAPKMHQVLRLSVFCIKPFISSFPQILKTDDSLLHLELQAISLRSWFSTLTQISLPTFKPTFHIVSSILHIYTKPDECAVKKLWQKNMNFCKYGQSLMHKSEEYPSSHKQLLLWNNFTY